MSTHVCGRYKFTLGVTRNFKMSLQKSCQRKLLAIGKTFCRYRYSTEQALSNEAVRKKRNQLFEAEKKRQLSLITRIEKITVEHRGLPEECTLLMNKGLSTPYNCAMHISEMLMNRSVIAKVNGKLWDMHRPLEEDCELKFLHFKDEYPIDCNNTFWRTCSFLLGHVMETAFKDQYYVQLCKFPRPSVESGSFVHDVDLSCLPEWTPDERELRCLSRIILNMAAEELPFERLTIHQDLALQMFKDNQYKSQQVSNIAKQSSSTGEHVTVYRVGDHIDLSRGPLISNTKQITRFNVTAVHDITDKEYGKLKRIQGLALPKDILLHYWTYEQLSKRSEKLNTSGDIQYKLQDNITTNTKRNSMSDKDVGFFKNVQQTATGTNEARAM